MRNESHRKSQLDQEKAETQKWLEEQERLERERRAQPPPEKSAVQQRPRPPGWYAKLADLVEHFPEKEAMRRLNEWCDAWEAEQAAAANVAVEPGDKAKESPKSGTQPSPDKELPVNDFPSTPTEQLMTQPNQLQCSKCGAVTEAACDCQVEYKSVPGERARKAV
jgi:hypothetical protein